MQRRQAFTTAILVFAVAVAGAGALAGCGRDTGVSTRQPRGSASASGSGIESAAVSPRPPGPSPHPTPAVRRFSGTIAKIPSRATVAYSWRSGCPVPLSRLRLLRMTYWGFDGRPHTGEMIVNASVARDVVKVFAKLYERRYPIRRMKLIDAYKGSDFDSIEADNTSAFNCRPATGSSAWSQHAYGLAIDLNPCENPYVTASGYVAHKHCVKFRNRARRDPGVIHAGDAVVRAFRSIGWDWGGSWPGTKDYQHFSSTGR